MGFHDSALSWRTKNVGIVMFWKLNYTHAADLPFIILLAAVEMPTCRHTDFVSPLIHLRQMLLMAATHWRPS